MPEHRRTMIGFVPLRWQIMLAFGSVAAVSMMSLVASLEAVHARNPAAGPMLPGHEVSQLALGLVVGSIMSLATIIGAAAILRSSIGDELTCMHEAASAISEGRLDHRIKSGRRDELGSLACDIDGMAERLERSERNRRIMLASVSHELRTPLMIIRAQAFTLARTEEEDDRRERLELIDDEVTRLAALVGDLLASASATQEVVVLDRAPTDVRSLLQVAARRFEGAARDREISVTIAAANDLPRICVDAARMHQVIGNLVANALAHAPRGSAVTLSACLPDSGQGVTISVTDAGPGIEPARLPTVFEAFTQGKRPTGSVGLGLTIVREFVRAHGGTVDVTSQPGCTRFDIALPAAAIQRSGRAARRRRSYARFA